MKARGPKSKLLLIFALALAIRAWGAWHAHLIFDERAHWALAETIDFRPGHLHLVSRTLDHPPLSIYVLRLASLIFGTSDFALRIPYILAGALTVIPVYFLGRRAFSPRAGLLAAGLLAVDLFHASWSRVFMPEVLLMLLAATAILQLLRAVERPTAGRFALLGLLLGLAWLAKETALFLLPAFALFLFVTPSARPLLRNPRLYLSLAVFAAVVAPELFWNAAQSGEGYLARDAVLTGQGRDWSGLSLKPLSLYIGDAFRWWIDPNALGDDYAEANMYVCHFVAGALYLSAVAACAFGVRRFIAALRPLAAFKGRHAAESQPASPALHLLLIVFFTIFGIFLVLPAGGFYEPFWWASLSLVPAVVCAGGLLDRIVGWTSESVHYKNRTMMDGLGGPAYKLATAATVLFIAALGAGTAWTLSNEGLDKPRATVADFAADFLAKGHAAVDRGDLADAERRFVYVLNIAGPNADAYCGLAQVAQRRGRPMQAARYLKKCRALDPRHAAALEWERLPCTSPS